MLTRGRVETNPPRSSLHPLNHWTISRSVDPVADHTVGSVATWDGTGEVKGQILIITQLKRTTLVGPSQAVAPGRTSVSFDPLVIP